MALFAIDYALSTNEDWIDSFVLKTPPEEGQEIGDTAAIDLTGSAFITHIRRSVETLDIALLVSTDNGKHYFDPVAGILGWLVEDEDLTALGAGTFVYDTQWIFPNGSETQFAIGTITISQGITR